jgi:dienelactone hydrolase
MDMFRALLVLAMASAVCFAAGRSHAAPPIETYGKLPAQEKLTLSPSGQRYAMIGVVGETRRLIVATVDQKLLFATVLGTAKVRSIDWAGEDHVLITLSATVNLDADFSVKNLEMYRVVSVNIATGRLTAIFTPQKGIEAPVFGEYGVRYINHQWYGYFGGVTMEKGLSGYFLSHTYPDLYRVDLDTGAPELVARGDENGDGWLVAPGGDVIAHATYNETSGDWKIMRGAYGGSVLASGNDSYGGVDLEGLGRKADTLLVRIPKAHGAVDAELPVAGGAAVEVPNDAEIDRNLFDRQTLTWIGYTGFGDIPETKMFDPVIAARVQGTRKAFPGLSVRFESWSDDFNRIIVFTSGVGDAGTYWLVDIPMGAADPIGHEYPDLQPADVGPIKMIDWKAADGQELHGVLTLPPGRAVHNLPVVVMPHGGPEARDYPVFDWWAQAFASQGYAVLQPNFRGSSGYGAAFIDAGQGEWGRKMQTDVSDGLAELVRQGVVDPKRACIVGASYGGYWALAGVTVEQGLYRCAVADAAVSDLTAMLRYEAQKSRGGSDSAETRYWASFMGPESALNDISPLHLAAKADAPILLIHGKEDTVVPYDQSVAMKNALLAAGKTVDLVTLPDEDHWLSREATRVLMLKSAVAFVEKYNPPDPAPPTFAAK